MRRSLEVPLPLTGRPLALHAFVVGFEPITESVSLLGGDPGRFLLEPVTASAVEYEDGWVLLDGGFNLAVVRSQPARAEHLNYESYAPLVPPGDPLAEGVARAGLDWSRLAGVAISHTHLDHTGVLATLAPEVPVIVQRREWEWVASGAGRPDVVLATDLLNVETQVRLVDGDATIAPGLESVATFGHTPGHQSFRVSLPSREIVLACDAADLRANIETRTPCGWTPGGDAGAAEARVSIERLADLDDAGVEVWPGHDPLWEPWMRAAKGEAVRVS
ncbi:N-acyl homoserine lactonase family protein [Demequina salsinemoris]|uniref:N-acyl homoserine lactonase family protein n=1 Tax=Demequina salsinemoris TaxID=577470 RepID=UPI00078268C4|nr:N-acyl homoserine lactonase family protein [Demequina salsinemoris]